MERYDSFNATVLILCNITVEILVIKTSNIAIKILPNTMRGSPILFPLFFIFNLQIKLYTAWQTVGKKLSLGITTVLETYEKYSFVRLTGRYTLQRASAHVSTQFIQLTENPAPRYVKTLLAYAFAP